MRCRVLLAAAGFLAASCAATPPADRPAPRADPSPAARDGEDPLAHLRDALLHAKTAVIDGVWSSVGSTNLDWRSFVHYYEADVIVFGAPFARSLEGLFARDVEHSAEIALADWRGRGPLPRMKEWMARAWEYFL